jgi:hypothetical protein
MAGWRAVDGRDRARSGVLRDGSGEMRGRESGLRSGGKRKLEKKQGRWKRNG